MTSDDQKIVCFVCNFAFCESNLEVPANANVVRVNCVGELDPVVVMDMFAKGADGVMIAGCRPPDCHFLEGNIQAERTVKMLKKLLTRAGLEPERIKLVWYSPIESTRFNHLVMEFSDELRRLLPSKSMNLDQLMTNIQAARNAAVDFQLRVLAGREKELTENANVYGEKLSQEEFDALLDELVKIEFIRQKMHVLASRKPVSVKTFSAELDMEPAVVLQHIVNMRRKNMLAFDHLEGQTPLYKALEVQ